MSLKDIKSEARQKLALNMHQAIIVYTIEFVIFVTLVALVVLACMCLNTASTAAAIVMICYGILLGLIAIVGFGMINYAMVDFYLASYRCKPYNVRRLGDTLARSGLTKVLLMSLKRTFLSFLLLLCLIVPGVIYIIRTSMANHLLIANPKMKASTALSASNKVMSGKTGAYFTLGMSMIGWQILGVLTLGLGFIFIAPYINLVKSVYYKRNLQGDKTVYTVAVQPVSVVQPMPNSVNGNAGATVRPDTAGGAQAPYAGQVREETVAPIDTLEESDAIEMNEAIRDVGGSQSIDVPEIPLKPITAHNSANEPPPIYPDPQPNAFDGTGIVETERTLTTNELDVADEFNSKFGDLYANSTPKSSNRDYITSTGKQTPNDFVTSELNDDQLIDQSSNVAKDSVMSDADFDAFLREFADNSTQHNTYAPSESVKQFDSTDFGLKNTSSDVFETSAQPTLNDTAPQTDLQDGEAEAPLSRAERVRREREARLRNLGK